MFARSWESWAPTAGEAGVGASELVAARVDEVLQWHDRLVGGLAALFVGGDRQLDGAVHAELVDAHEVALVLELADQAARADGGGGDQFLQRGPIGLVIGAAPRRQRRRRRRGKRQQQRRPVSFGCESARFLQEDGYDGAARCNGDGIKRSNASSAAGQPG